MRRHDLRNVVWTLGVCFLAQLALGTGHAIAADDKPTEKLMAIIPAQSNTIVVVDVNAVNQSAFAQAWGWTGDSAAAGKGAPNPLARVKGVGQFVAAARMNFNTMDSQWETAVLQRTDPKEGLPGMSVDKLGGRPTNRGLSGLLLVDLGNGVVAAIHDADRQLAAQWIEQRTSGKPAGEKASDYLQQAAARAGGATPIVVAYDLKDVVSVPDAMHTILGDPPEALATVSEEDAAELAKLFASIRGVTVSISADKEPRGEAIINFGENASKLGDNAKSVLLELLGRQGMAISDFKNWDFKVSGDRVIATGGFSTGGVRRMMRVIRTPNAPSPAVAKKADPGAKIDPANPAAASQRYFAAISEIIDEIKPANELKETATWVARDAKQIDALPILGVDPELVAWGGHVSSTLRDLAAIQASGQRQVKAQSNTFSAPTAVYDSYQDTDTRTGIQTRADWNNYQRQRRQAVDAVRVGITEQSAKVAQDLLKSRNDIRVAMTQKYNAEF